MTRTALLAILLLAGCGNPVQTNAVEALGPEVAGVPEGPEHRPGQPCLTCHGGEGPAALEMSFAGTVFAHASGGAPVAGATVLVADDRGLTFSTSTNCAGNFWIPLRRFEPVFPATASVVAPGYTPVMTTAMNQSGSCNECHSGPPGPATPGRVWLYPDAVSPGVHACPGGVP